MPFSVRNSTAPRPGRIRDFHHGLIEHVGIAGTLLQAYLRRRFDMDELEAALGDLSQVLWLSPAVVAEVLRLAREATR